MAHEKTPNWHPSQKSRRCYHRVISGIERGGDLRFITLTSSKDSPDTCQNSFRALYGRLKRRGLIQGYIKVPEPSKNGKQHVHVLMRGKFILQSELSTMWQEIHHAKIVDIRKVWSNVDKRKLASDMASYMSKENMYRYSWSWGWVWRGFCNDWMKLKRVRNILQAAGEYIPFADLLALWRNWLHGTWQPDFSLLPQPP